MVLMLGYGAVGEPPIGRSVAATVPVLTRIEPTGTRAVSAVPGVPIGDQLLGVVHADWVVAVQVKVGPAVITSRDDLFFGIRIRYGHDRQ
jgi:hypothetical protein